MAEYLHDDGVTITLGSGTLTHWRNVSEEGGELKGYVVTPPGGPPAVEYNEDVRAQRKLNLETLVPIDVSDLDFVAKGATFTSGQVAVTGVESTTHGWVVEDRKIKHTFEDNSMMTIVLAEGMPE